MLRYIFKVDFSQDVERINVNLVSNEIPGIFANVGYSILEVCSAHVLPTIRKHCQNNRFIFYVSRFGVRLVYFFYD